MGNRLKQILTRSFAITLLIFATRCGSGGTSQQSGSLIASSYSSGCTNSNYPINPGSGSVYAVPTGASAVATDTATGRYYMNFVPAPVAGSVPGLILVFHGTIDPIGGNPPASGLAPIPAPGSPASNGMESNGHFTVIYFNAEVHNDADTTYIYGYNSPGVRAWDQRNPSLNTDVPYVRSVYSSMEKVLCFDTSRIFTYGFSSGGFFANNLANFQPVPGVMIKGAGIDHGGLIQGATFINTTAPQATGAKKIFLNTNSTDTVVTSAVTAQAQTFWSVPGVSVTLVNTGSGHVPMDNTTLGQMLVFFLQ